MSAIINITNSEAFRRRVDSVLEALEMQEVTKAEVHAEFLEACGDQAEGQEAWERCRRLDNPSAAELGLYARVLRVNTTWLITGDVRFINQGLMAETCLCWLLPVSDHFVYYGATEPGSTHDYNPDCLLHGPALTQERLQRTALMDLVLGRKLPKPAIDLDLSSIRAEDYSKTEF